jgi:hypothetical protein
MGLSSALHEKVKVGFHLT